VLDFGIGIPENIHGRIFERFFRASDPENTFPGIGLGLYISAEIIKRHKGKIWFNSKLGKGSTFWFSLPLKEGE
jgi:two-component system CheB/CheR fusion protein